MPRYRYKALASNGELVVGRVSAGARDDAFRKLRGRGVVPLEAELDDRRGRESGGFFDRFRTQKIAHSDILVFTRELSTLLRAGISLDRALDKLADARAGGSLGQSLRRVSAQVKSGSTLAAALAKMGGVFPPFYSGLVRAGEAAGTLPSVLEDIAGVIQSTQELREKVVGSLLYPFIVLALIGVSFVILMAWVVPEFRPLLERPGAKIPLSASAVLFLSNVVVNWGWLFLLGLAGLALIAARLSATGRLRPHTDRLLLKIPQVASIVREVEAARYCRSLGTLLSNGVSLLDAVELANATVSNVVLARALGSVQSSLSRGGRLADALANSGAIPALPLQIVDVGEESGKLDGMLFLAASTCQQNAQRALEKWVVLLAPFVTVVLGIFVAVIIGSILSAILSTYDVPT